MNLILLERSDFLTEDRIALRTGDPRFTHISTILNSQVGETLRVGELNGNMGTGVITQRNAESIEMHVTLDQSPPPKLPLTILLALPRPKMMRRILRTVAETGVQKLILLNTYKVEKSYWSSPAIAPETIDMYFREGLQQSRDTVLPHIEFARLFKPFAEDKLPGLLAGTRGLIAHPGAHPKCPTAFNEATTLAIGPEGGFTPYEIQKMAEAGMECVQLGARILRVDTAVTSLIARLFA